ncbi:concanavalin A-like lectin/glucanase [Pyrococcus abyssi virus 1]|uniref:concanavalin A-like lectin/glucanase n=1 Tax=Pyrococcus abyssi virus 1 TaxID=425386 RepID=UPI00015529C1|nr:concanavalin A-like lectin/glucanase [Pyrococcus abyssi virus 1]ABN58500.1 concanavalin A-like lectin/glucanase [Pyrococcus abyssi virus 1]
MTRRLSALLIIILAGLLAPQVKAATTSYYGVQFDGVDDYVSFNSVTLDANASTVIIFFRVNAFSDSAYGERANIISKDSGKYNSYIGFTSSGIYAEGNTNGDYWAIYPYTLNLGKTYMLALVADSEQVTTYLDTTKLGTRPVLSNMTVNALGGAYAGSDNFFDGKIYLVLIYNRALSESEIQAIYEDPSNPPTSGLVLWYAPDSVDPSTNTWHDKSGNGHDGSIYGATYVPLRPISESEFSDAYGVAFGSGDYVVASNVVTGKQLTAIVFASVDKFYTPDDPNKGLQPLVSKGSDRFKLYVGGNYARFILVDNSLNVYRLIAGAVENEVFMLAGVVDNTIAKIYLNGELKETETLSDVISDYVDTADIFLGKRSPGDYQQLDGKIYLVLIYNRALSDSEIRQIYENPSNPPLDGLILWYDPYSYDPSTGKWLNRAPIFPTIPLVEELDGVNYGAEAVRVSIPAVKAYDATDNSEISVYNLTIKSIDGETFIPWFMPLPYNQTLTLNVTAPGYKSAIISVQAPIDNLVFYLYPSQVITSWESAQININLNNITADEFLPDASQDIDKFSSLFTRWLGGEYFKHLLSLDLEGMLKDFFNNPPIPGLGILVALMIWAASVLMTWLYFEEPEPVFVEGNIVYFGLMQFIDVSPGILAVPLGVFILFLGYKQLYKALKVWAKR